MATAKATSAGDDASTTTRVAARKPPAIHALPVNDPSTPKHVEPSNASLLPVRPGEDAWTEGELTEVIEVLEADIVRFAEQLQVSTAELDAEMSLANNAREMLDQSKLALRHIELGTYGSCDNCGQPIGKGRLQAFPRATLCVKCKQREERR
jgi:DnaK suppressor protein